MFSVRRIYLAIRPPAPSRVFTRSCERPLPAQCPRSIRRRWNPSDRRNRCTCAGAAALARHFAVKLHCLLADAVRFISSEKRKGARKTFTCAIYARGARRQRYSEERESVGVQPRTPGGSLVSPVGWTGRAAARRRCPCVGERRATPAAHISFTYLVPTTPRTLVCT